MTTIIQACELWPGEREVRAPMPAHISETMAMIGSRAGNRYLFTVPFLRFDAGRSASRRGRQKNDCTVRALAMASGASYDTAYDELAKAGRKCARGFNFKAWAKSASFTGWRFRWRSFPATKGHLRVTPVTFALAHPRGRFILRTAKHVLACVDGVIIDEGRGSEISCVYGAWELFAHPTPGDSPCK